MEERSTKFSLLVTGIFLLGLLILAAILKPNRASESSAGPGNVVAKTNGTNGLTAPAAIPAPLSQQMMPPPPRDGVHPPIPAPGFRREEAPSVPEEKARQQILTNCKIKVEAANDGDSFSILTRSGEYRFSLYFVDSPELNLGSIEQVRAHSAYFGNLTEEQLRNVARSAKEYVAKVLADRTFDVVTRWERAPEESPNHEITCRAFVYLTARSGEPTNLATLLVQEGLATVCSSNETLPDGTSAGTFLGDLQVLEQKAIATKKGAWQYSAAQQNTTPVRYITH
jgi:endonuclease YncB( thermonuclease family)